MARVIGLIVSLLIAGCVSGPPLICDDAGWEPGVSCETVVAAAQSELAGVGIVRLTARPGMHCPIDEPMSCPLTPFVYTVYADLADGRQLAVRVDVDDDGALRARPAEDVAPQR